MVIEAAVETSVWLGRSRIVVATNFVGAIRNTIRNAIIVMGMVVMVILVGAIRKAIMVMGIVVMVILMVAVRWDIL
jgi:hypothetical protein